MATVSARYLDLARKSKRELDAVFTAGSPPDISSLTGVRVPRLQPATRILRDYPARADSGSDELLLGKAFFVVAGTRVTHSYFLIERYRPLTDATTLANR